MKASAKAGSINNCLVVGRRLHLPDCSHPDPGLPASRCDQPFGYVGFGKNGPGDGGDSIFLANSIQWSDFNGPGEKSLQAQLRPEP